MSDEARFRALVENSTDLLCVLEEAGTLLYANPAVERLFGRSDLEGEDFLGWVHEEDRESLRAMMQRPAASPSELRFRSGDGTYRRLETSVRDSSAGLMLDARDVTERHIAQDSLHVMAKNIKNC